jgi:hypothetical protein
MLLSETCMHEHEAAAVKLASKEDAAEQERDWTDMGWPKRTAAGRTYDKDTFVSVTGLCICVRVFILGLGLD